MEPMLLLHIFEELRTMNMLTKLNLIYQIACDSYNIGKMNQDNFSNFLDEVNEMLNKKEEET